MKKVTTRKELQSVVLNRPVYMPSITIRGVILQEAYAGKTNYSNTFLTFHPDHFIKSINHMFPDCDVTAEPVVIEGHQCVKLVVDWS